VVTINRCRDYGEMSRRAAESVMAVVAAKPDSLLCLPTGNSPAGLYQALSREAQTSPDLFRSLRVIKLDEWLGVPASDSSSCEYFLRNRILGPLAVGADRYISFDGEAPDPQAECERISKELERHGPIDLCILGLGRNGHLGLNEPGASLQPHCHVATLSEQTRHHYMVGERKEKPVQGLTLGLRDLLQARKIVLPITGAGKEAALARFLERTVTTEVPATFLWLHPDVEVFLDEAGAGVR
jgi:galactosamine-6-phosphate isomerase